MSGLYLGLLILIIMSNAAVKILLRKIYKIPKVKRVFFLITM
jgi:hypothetical protein